VTRWQIFMRVPWPFRQLKLHGLKIIDGLAKLHAVLGLVD
jgi:hypothetical protein